MIAEIEKLLDAAALVSRADAKGRITHVNRKFSEVSGWDLEDVVGRDHRILNSGRHSREFWSGMYATTVRDRRVWNSVVTNRRKDGSIYHVDTYIMANRDEDDNLVGFTSIRQDVTSILSTLDELARKNNYLEHAAKILRHDMHSGINIYIPRGVSALVRRLPPAVIVDNNLEPPLKMLQEGLLHTQRVYKGVREFTNLVKPGAQLEKAPCDLTESLISFLGSTAYSDQVLVMPLPTIDVNESLFCTAVDNLIRNGLKYNDSDTKIVSVYMADGDTLVVEDNGRGLSPEDFAIYSQPYSRRPDQKEKGTGLGLGIAIAIFKEHGFEMSCAKLHQGTQMRIKLR